MRNNVPVITILKNLSFTHYPDDQETSALTEIHYPWYILVYDINLIENHFVVELLYFINDYNRTTRIWLKNIVKKRITRNIEIRYVVYIQFHVDFINVVCN